MDHIIERVRRWRRRKRKQRILLAEAKRDYLQSVEYGGEEFAWKRAREILSGICPESGIPFENCSEGVCDCGWEVLPWDRKRGKK